MNASVVRARESVGGGMSEFHYGIPLCTAPPTPGPRAGGGNVHRGGIFVAKPQSPAGVRHVWCTEEGGRGEGQRKGEERQTERTPPKNGVEITAKMLYCSGPRVVGGMLIQKVHSKRTQLCPINNNEDGMEDQHK